MASNVEIKARVLDPDTLRNRALSLATATPEIIEQVDTFYESRTGRLKLREFGDGTGELIYYERPDTLTPTESAYRRIEVPDPASLHECLRQSNGVRGVVKKRRELIRVGQTRVHLDEVQGLGNYMELEVVLRKGQSADEGHHIAEGLMSELGIEAPDLIACAYIDLIR